MTTGDGSSIYFLPYRIMKKYAGELLGTFFFVLSIWLAVNFAGVRAGLVIGSALMVLVYAGGHISGGHYNPAVTLGLATSGKLSWSVLLPYWVSQLVWAVLGGFLVTWIVGAHLSPASIDPSSLKVIVVELLYTFLLVWVVHNVAATTCNKGNSFYGLAIGFVIFIGASTVGGISWWAFNPAVVIGSLFDGLFTSSAIWPHIVGQLLWGIFAGLAYRGLACDTD